MRLQPTAPVLLLVLLLSPLPAQGDIYRYVDGMGTVHFSDVPLHEGYRLHLREGALRPATAGYNYPYRRLIREAASSFDLDEPLLRAVVEVESDFNRYALSSAGARGLMQLMPDTMVSMGVSNPWDPRQNLMGGARFLKQLMVTFRGDLRLSLAAYNAGASAVKRYGSIPPYPQTQRYVKKVLERYYRYAASE